MKTNTVDLFEFRTASEYLRGLLEYRSRQNPAYSLRSFARDLGISATTLSHLLNKKAILSPKTLSSIVDSLRLKRKEARYLNLLVAFENSENEKQRVEILPQLRAISDIWKDVYSVPPSQNSVLDSWYILPMLEILQVHSQPKDLMLMANRLGITAMEAQRAVEQLLKLGLIAMSESNKFLRTKKKIIISSEKKCQKLQDFHRQMLVKARNSIIEQDNQEKMVGSETFAISKEDLPEIRELVETCFQNIISVCEKTKSPTDVYHIGIQLFNLTSRKS
jgi:uncharacterized protein (TIGR02147 family)